MHLSPILFFHICGGTLGILSGTVAIFLRKGSRRHALAGTVFIISMLILGASGVYMAILKTEPGNILGGAFTCYLVATSWISAKRKQVGPDIFHWGALLLVSALTIVELTLGIEAAVSSTGMKYGYPPGPYFFIGSVALIAATGDVRMLIRREISGTQRSRVICGGYALHFSSPLLLFSWRERIFFPPSCGEQAHSIFSAFFH